MKTAIILHGMPEEKEFRNPQNPAESNKHWLPWLQRQLVLNDVLAQTPELPKPYHPSYEEWRSVFEGFKPNPETFLVGHSCGGGFLVRWLSESKIKVGKVALIAPWIDPKSDRVQEGFFNFAVDPDLYAKTNGLALFISRDDGKDIQNTLTILKKELKNLEVKEFLNKGHFTLEEMKSAEFPELRDWFLW